ncbi:hypothetical protein NOSIN_18625 [Nocardiopsis sinuspersici]|uniref:Tc1-like transposase DDE domain-containing protein n=1 Tax=Nocardiopsis sinuspersici TaxID=501010 RepID=A0A1V3C4N0_9ACTN|nr:hypothetical protein NOSIN_18625 [Nocardiopsis sinuspersici]
MCLFHCVQEASITHTDLRVALDRLHRALRGPVVLVWDNHSLHTCKPMAVQVAARGWLNVVCLPRYAPELNPVESLWSHLKSVLRSRLFRNLEELKQVVNAHLRLVCQRPDLLRGFIDSVGLQPSPFQSTE